MKIPYGLEYLGNRLDDVFETLGNAGTTKIQHRFLSFETELGAKFGNPCGIHLRGVPKIGVDAVVDRGELFVRGAEKQTEAVFGVVRDAEHLGERKKENRPFEDFEKESLSSHETVPELAENLMYREDDGLSGKDAENARRNGRSVRGGMDDVGVLCQTVAAERNAQHEAEAVASAAVDFDVLPHFFILGHVLVVAARKNRYAVAAFGQAFDDVAKKDFGSADMRYVVVEDEEDFHAIEVVLAILSKPERFPNFTIRSESAIVSLHIPFPGFFFDNH